MPPECHPADGQTRDLEMVGCAFRDDEPAYWTLQRENLRRQFDAKVRGRVERQEIRHLSVFALAPQPLLIELGRLLCDIVPAAVHQRHREPASWRWASDGPLITFRTTEPDDRLPSKVALKLAVSATVTDERLQAVAGGDAAIWSTLRGSTSQLHSAGRFDVYTTASRLAMARERSCMSFQRSPPRWRLRFARVDAQVGSSSPLVRQQPIAQIHFDL